jgi:hypothetical protein
LGYFPLKNHPLWYHLNVAIFDEQVNKICQDIQNNYYDMIIFQDIPGLDNFYPYKLRDCTKNNYSKVLEFEAPRKKTEGNSIIEVYELVNNKTN